MDPVMTILIPTYKNPQLLQTCLHTLLLNTEFPYKIVVLNNDSSAGSKETIDGIVAGCQFPQISVRHLGSNMGWMGAINAGMEQVDTPLVCLLNDDVVFVPGQNDFWRRLTGHFSNAETAAVGPSSNFVMGAQSIFMYHGIPPSMYAKFLIGFCMVLDSDKFREVGLLDENLPGGDDLDLSIRLRQAGYKLLCEKTAYLHHIGSQTGNRVHSGYWNSDLQTDRSNNALIRKHGLKAWYELVSGTPVDLSLTPEINGLRSREDEWVAEQTPDTRKGFSVGSGAKKIKGEYGLDRARAGEHGAGGRKFTGATNDTTGDANDLPLLDDSLDYLLALHIFEHLLDPFAVLKEWKRVLKPGGKLIVVCPDHRAMPTMMIDYTHLHAFTPESLLSIVRASGFEVELGECFITGTFGLVAYKRQVVEDPEYSFQRIMGDG